MQLSSFSSSAYLSFQAHILSRTGNKGCLVWEVWVRDLQACTHWRSRPSWCPPFCGDGPTMEIQVWSRCECSNNTHAEPQRARPSRFISSLSLCTDPWLPPGLQPCFSGCLRLTSVGILGSRIGVAERGCSKFIVTCCGPLLSPKEKHIWLPVERLCLSSFPPST